MRPPRWRVCVAPPQVPNRIALLLPSSMVPPQTCYDDFRRSDGAPNKTEKRHKIRNRRLTYYVEPRQGCLKILVEQWKAVLHFQSAGGHLFRQIVHPGEVHLVAGRANDVIRYKRIASLKAGLHGAVRGCPPGDDSRLGPNTHVFPVHARPKPRLKLESARPPELAVNSLLFSRIETPEPAAHAQGILNHRIGKRPIGSHEARRLVPEGQVDGFGSRFGH